MTSLMNIAKGIYSCRILPLLMDQPGLAAKAPAEKPYPYDYWKLLPSEYPDEVLVYSDADRKARYIGPSGARCAINYTMVSDSFVKDWDSIVFTKYANEGILKIQGHEVLRGRIHDVAVAENIIAVATRSALIFYERKGSEIQEINRLGGSGYTHAAFSPNHRWLYLIKHGKIKVMKGDGKHARTHFTDSRLFMVIDKVASIALVTLLGASLGLLVGYLINYKVACTALCAFLSLGASLKTFLIDPKVL